MLILKEPKLLNKETFECEVGYALDADQYQVILYKSSYGTKGVSRGEIKHYPIAFCVSIEQALNKVYMQEVGLVGLDDLKRLDEHLRATISTCVANLGKLNYIRGNIEG